jgi:sterol desaturase/sphingolipid hydroxylase (fatty acid hydroxylase superfamily)
MIGIPLGLVAFNAGEWVTHKYMLHGLGRNRESFWAFHWHEHHHEVRKHDHRDPDYDKPFFQASARRKEAFSLMGVGAAVAPLLPVAPFFVGTIWYGLARYYQVHKKAHVDPAWAREHLPWHYDHHMGPDQNANWCVTKPWFDHLMGTRKPYVGTEREQKDQERRAKRAEKKAARRGEEAAE